MPRANEIVVYQVSSARGVHADWAEKVFLGQASCDQRLFDGRWKGLDGGPTERDSPQPFSLFASKLLVLRHDAIP